MKVLLDIKDKKASFVLELLANFPFVFLCRGKKATGVEGVCKVVKQ